MESRFLTELIVVLLLSGMIFFLTLLLGLGFGTFVFKLLSRMTANNSLRATGPAPHWWLLLVAINC